MTILYSRWNRFFRYNRFQWSYFLRDRVVSVAHRASTGLHEWVIITSMLEEDECMGTISLSFMNLFIGRPFATTATNKTFSPKLVGSKSFDLTLLKPNRERWGCDLRKQRGSTKAFRDFVRSVNRQIHARPFAGIVDWRVSEDRQSDWTKDNQVRRWSRPSTINSTAAVDISLPRPLASHAIRYFNTRDKMLPSVADGHPCRDAISPRFCRSLTSWIDHHTAEDTPHREITSTSRASSRYHL